SGTTIAVRLLNRIVTSDSRNPVIAVVTTEATSPSGFSLAVGTKILGNAQAESGFERVQVSFHTLIFENGSEQAFNGIATMPDGSSGIAGEYHSQVLKKEGGRFLSKFIGGFADGFKDREKGNLVPFEPGNLKNAALGGISESASEQAKTYETEMKNVTPYVSVEPGTSFMIFLEKGMTL
ncbi:MAG: TrbI/VirB10 family protein, partial [Bdellovibrionales bacterium]|nr:TrbI/VirB10 family protein [Bdellovibrionales bacterium]